MRLHHLLLSINGRHRPLGSVVLLVLITVSPLLHGFLPAVSLRLHVPEEFTNGAGSQGSSDLDIEIDRAEQMRADGRYEEAAAAYRAAMSRGLSTATVALAGAEASLAARDYSVVLDLTSIALAANPAATDAFALRGEAFYRLGDQAQAVGAFRAHLAVDPVGGYAAFRAAEIAADAGDVNAAGDLYRRSIDLGMSPAWEASAGRRIARIYTVAAQPIDAVGWLERAHAAAAEVQRRGLPVWYDGELVNRNAEAARPAILLELGHARRQAGLIDEAIDAYSDVVAVFPAAAEAEAALDTLSEMGALSAVTGYARGLVHFNAERPRDAIAELSAFSTTSTDPQRLARTAYYTALARRNAGDRGAARDGLYAMASSFPADALAPEAVWQAARLAESIGMRGDEALRAYLLVADEYPSSDQGARSLVQAGDLAVGLGDRTLARQIWGRLASHPNAGSRAQGLLRLGRDRLAAGDTAAAVASLSDVAAQAPSSYEAARARDLLERGLGAEPYEATTTAGLAPEPGDDAAACADWITSWTDESSTPARASRVLDRIDRLLLIGLRGPAQAEALDAIAASAASPRDLDALARGLADHHLYPTSIFAAQRLGAASPAGSAERGPPCLQRLLYPVAYRELVEEQAQQRGLDPYLLLALLRQESWFGSHARSSADARGLSQVLPSTGTGIARSLGRSSFDAEDLYRPTESVVFGAWYLAEQIRNLGGRSLLALSAYNGGAGNALRWSGRNMRVDPDDFVDAIDFAETRGYVRAIYQMHSRYLELYG